MRILVFDQSSPVHPVSESRGGTLSVTYIHTQQEQDRIPSFSFWIRTMSPGLESNDTIPTMKISRTHSTC